MKSIGEVTRALDRLAPPSTAEDWDNVGLLVGDPEWKTAGAIVSIDLTEDAIELARKRGYSLIINHHPCIFPKSRGLARVTPSGGMRSLVFRALEQKIAVYSTHTNFDQCALEVVEELAREFGATPRGRLLEHADESLLKLVTFVPAAHVEKVRQALAEAGAGKIGDYDSCAFLAEGEGTFRGGESTNPFLGKPGHLERATETRIETILPRGLKGQVLEALRAAHPYEEVAYDLYSLEQRPPAKGVVRGLGYGFWGELKEPKPYAEFHKDVIRIFGVSGYLHTQPLPQAVRRFAFVAGKGASFVDAAAQLGCDLFITGEAGYHTALAGSHRGMAVLELGHRESEKFFLSTASDWVRELGLRAEPLDLPTQNFQFGKE